uniref:CG30 n=1 Tax=Spodoptera frugiperda nuclear polyhedrosis virus TaxID=10455 RepID=A0A7G3W7S9_NPVSF|nr:CG30 [Spodoptera frugiperda multiple nucleopolyhedrovirus]
MDLVTIQCIVCLVETTIDHTKVEEVFVVPFLKLNNCNHVMCVDCIKNMTTPLSCPVCRRVSIAVRSTWFGNYNNEVWSYDLKSLISEIKKLPKKPIKQTKNSLLTSINNSFTYGVIKTTNSQPSTSSATISNEIINVESEDEDFVTNQVSNVCTSSDVGNSDPVASTSTSSVTTTSNDSVASTSSNHIANNSTEPVASTSTENIANGPVDLNDARIVAISAKINDLMNQQYNAVLTLSNVQHQIDTLHVEQNTLLNINEELTRTKEELTCAKEELICTQEAITQDINSKRQEMTYLEARLHIYNCNVKYAEMELKKINKDLKAKRLQLSNTKTESKSTSTESNSSESKSTSTDCLKDFITSFDSNEEFNKRFANKNTKKYVESLINYIMIKTENQKKCTNEQIQKLLQSHDRYFIINENIFSPKRKQCDNSNGDNDDNDDVDIIIEINDENVKKKLKIN